MLPLLLLLYRWKDDGIIRTNSVLFGSFLSVIGPVLSFLIDQFRQIHLVLRFLCDVLVFLGFQNRRSLMLYLII